MVVAGSRLPAPGYRIAASGFDLTAFSLQKRLNHQNVQRSDMTLRSRLAAGLVIIAIILVTPLVLAITSLRRLHDDATTLRDRHGFHLDTSHFAVVGRCDACARTWMRPHPMDNLL